jgi:hypothetical protein
MMWSGMQRAPAASKPVVAFTCVCALPSKDRAERAEQSLSILRAACAHTTLLGVGGLQQSCKLKLASTDVRQRGCKLIAMLPSWTHADFFKDWVMQSHRIYFLQSTLQFTNPLLPQAVAATL